MFQCDQCEYVVTNYRESAALGFDELPDGHEHSCSSPAHIVRYNQSLGFMEKLSKFTNFEYVSV